MLCALRLWSQRGREERDVLRWLLRMQRIRGDARAARRGPKVLGKRVLERGVVRLVRRLFR